MDLDNQHFECVYLGFVLKASELCFQIKNIKKEEGL